jgi:protein SCO1/2
VVAAVLLALASMVPAAADDLSDFAFDPHPGSHLPLAAPLFDEAGHRVRLGDFFAGRPVVLVLDYLRCRTLCGVTLSRLASALDALPPGTRQYDVVALSIDPRDNPADLVAGRRKYAGNRPGWHFLGGAEPAVRRIAEAVGFPYRFDPALGQYVHPAGFVVASPNGIVSRYLLGVGPSPAALESALADAKEGRAIGPLERLLLLCHGEGAPLGRYTLPVETAFIIANLAAITGAVFVFAMIWRRRHG